MSVNLDSVSLTKISVFALYYLFILFFHSDLHLPEAVLFFFSLTSCNSQLGHLLLNFWISWSGQAFKIFFIKILAFLFPLILHIFTCDSQSVMRLQRQSQIWDIIFYKIMIFHLQCGIDSCPIILSFMFCEFLMALSTAVIPKLSHSPLNNLCKLFDLIYFSH